MDPKPRRPMTVYMIPAIVLAVLVIAGWLIVRSTQPELPGSLVNVNGYQPLWYAELGDRDYVFTYGEAVRPSDIEAQAAAEEEAISKAPVSIDMYAYDLLADLIDVTADMDSSYVNAINHAVSIVADQGVAGAEFSDTEIVDTEQGQYAAYVRYQIPTSEIRQTLVDLIRSTEGLYDLIGETEAFQELAAEG